MTPYHVAAHRSQPSDGNLVLAKSHTATNRQKAEAEESRADAARRKQRLAMRKRGHKLVPKRGDDPTHDAREKQHVKLATRYTYAVCPGTG